MKKKKTEIKQFENKLQKVVVFDENNKAVIAEETENAIVFFCENNMVKMAATGECSAELIRNLALNAHKLFIQILDQIKRNEINNKKSPN